MTQGFRRFFAGLSVCFLLAMGAAYGFLQRYVQTGAFKAAAMQHLEAKFGGRVAIGSIQVRSFNKVLLTGIVIEKGEAPSRVGLEIPRAVFRYPLTQLLSRNFRIPSSIFLEAPRLEVEDPLVLRDVLAGSQNEALRSLFSKIDFRDGRIKCRVPGINTPVILREIRGSFRPGFNGIANLDFKASAEGVLSGPFHLKAYVDLLKKQYGIKVMLEGARLSGDFPVDLEDIRGALTLENGNFRAGPLKVKSHGWESVLEASMDGGNSPVLRLAMDLGKNERLGRLEASVDLAKQKIHASAGFLAGRRFEFEGGIRREATKIFLENLTTSGGQSGRGMLDFQSGDYSLAFENGFQRLSVTSNLSGLDFTLGLDLNHLDFFGMDLVMASRVELTPVEPSWGNDAWEFQANFSTDYFILEQEPFDDFRGKFRLDPRGIKDFSGAWGSIFEMTGKVMLDRREPECDLALKVSGLDLAGAKEFAARPLPPLRGVAEGKLKIEGAARKPDVSGVFSIKDGALGKLEFDRAMIQFRGFPPYLALDDSRIFKGRTTLHLVGAFDLSLDNILAGVRVETADKLILWKGMSLSANEADSNLELDVLSRLSTLNLDLKNENKGTRLGESDPLTEENYAAVGPKIKF
ncbi:MAG TPA: hypothetical protein VL688_01655 [Verrucomicrobiae bacterium]|jgi:hypothetical protein|nr:hypothetical protein [Verrucomicrobiae bacterium]